MPFLAALVALGPLLGLMVLLVIRTRHLWARTPVTIEPYRPRQGGETAGDREPRRPLAPVGAGSVALPLPLPPDGDGDGDGGGDAPARPVAPPTLPSERPARGRRAS